MALRNVKGQSQPDVTNWTLEIIVPLIIMLILFTGSIYLSSKTGRSEYSEKDIVAFETYTRYSKQLDSIGERYSKVLETE